MVGGIVIEVAEVKDRPEVLYVDCRDTTYRKDTCAVYVERNATSEQIQIGDSVWWQCGKVYWTPQRNIGLENAKCGKDYDIPIPKVGYSGVKHPARN